MCTVAPLLPSRERERVFHGTAGPRGVRTHACRVHTRVNAQMFLEQGCSQERRAIPAGNVFGDRNLGAAAPLFPRACAEVSGECVRHNRVTRKQ